MKGKYPASLFWTLLITNILVKHIYLFIPATTLLIVGIWVRPCLYIGLGLLLLDIGLSLFSALHNRHVFLTSDDPNFREAQEAILSENWKENLDRMLESNNESDEFAEENTEHQD